MPAHRVCGVRGRLQDNDDVFHRVAHVLHRAVSIHQNRHDRCCQLLAYSCAADEADKKSTDGRGPERNGIMYLELKDFH